MPDINFKDPKTREAYFEPEPGRPTLREIIDDICDMVAFVGPRAETDARFLSNDLCVGVRMYYPGHGHYIGHWVSKLAEDPSVPIRRVGTRNRRARYSIVI